MKNISIDEFRALKNGNISVDRARALNTEMNEQRKKRAEETLNNLMNPISNIAQSTISGMQNRPTMSDILSDFNSKRKVFEEEQKKQATNTLNNIASKGANLLDLVGNRTNNIIDDVRQSGAEDLSSYVQRKNQEKAITNLRANPTSPLFDYGIFANEKIKQENRQNGRYKSMSEDKKIQQALNLQNNLRTEATPGQKVGYTLGDVANNVTHGMTDTASNLLKGFLYWQGDMANAFNNKEKADLLYKIAGTKDAASQYVYEPLQEELEKYSKLDDTGRQVAQGIGQQLTRVGLSAGGNILAGGLGLTETGTRLFNDIASNTGMFTGSMASARDEAISQGATQDQARVYGYLSGLSETASESMFGGFGKLTDAMGISRGVGGLDEKLSYGLRKNISNAFARNLINLGVSAVGEGTEEVVSGLASALWKKLTYLPDEDLRKLIEDEKLADSFVVGMLTSAIFQIPEYTSSSLSGTDMSTGQNIKESVANEKLQQQYKSMMDEWKKENPEAYRMMKTSEEYFDKNPILKEGSLIESAEKYGYNPNTVEIQATQRMLDKAGIKVEFSDEINDPNIEGLWTVDNNGNRSIIINPYASKETIFQKVAVHELTHDILNKDIKEAESFKKDILDLISKEKSFTEAKTKIENLYKNITENGKPIYDLTTEEGKKKFNDIVEEELITNAMAEKFGVQEEINKLVSYKPSLARRIYDKVVEFFGKATGNEKLLWKNVQNKFERAFSQEGQFKTNEERYSTKKVDGNETEPIKTQYKGEAKEYKNYYDYMKDVSHNEEELANTLLFKHNSFNFEIPTNKNETSFYHGTDYDGYYKDLNLQDYSYGMDRNYGDYFYVTSDKKQTTPYGRQIAQFIIPNDKILSLEEYRKMKNVSDEEIFNKYLAIEMPDNEYIIKDINKVKEYTLNRAKEYIKNKEQQTQPTTDNQGRTLSKQQQEYFKDSKVRDENGKLQVMYHTTPEKFTIFDKSKLGDNTNYNNTSFGFFVTPNKEFSERFGDIDKVGKDSNVMELYIDAKKPIIHPYNAHYKYEGNELDDIVRNYFKAIGEQEGLAELESYAEEEGETLYDTYMGLTIEEDPFEYAKDERKSLQKNGYDSVIFIEGNENNTINDNKGFEPVISYAVFNPNQIKNVDNTNPTKSNDIRYSVNLSNKTQNANLPTTDNQGNTIKPGMQQYMKESKARVDKNGQVDKNGKLATVYHTTTDKIAQFNEFNPVGTQGYRFGDQVVNYYTDSKDMSGSYANNKYKTADTRKLKSMNEVKEYLDNLNNNTEEIKYAKEKANGNRYRIENISGINYIIESSDVDSEALSFLNSLSKSELEQLNNNIFRDEDFIGTPYEYEFAWDKFDKPLLDKYKKMTDKYVGDDTLVDIQKRMIEYLRNPAKYNENKVYNGTLVGAYETEDELFKNLKQDIQKADWTNNSKIQYEGYVNITNPYIIDAEGRSWGEVSQEMSNGIKKDVSTIEKLNEDQKNDIIEYGRKLAKERYKKDSAVDEFNAQVSNKVLSEGAVFLNLLDVDGEFDFDKIERDIRLYGLRPDLYKILDTLGIKYEQADNLIPALELLKENKAKINEYINKKKYILDLDDGYGNEEMSLSDIAKWKNYIKKRATGRQYNDEFKHYLTQKYNIKQESTVKNIVNDIMSRIGYDGTSSDNKTIENYVFYDTGISSTLGRIKRTNLEQKSTNDIVKQVIEMNKNGANYDGVIIKNCIDYGEYTSNVEPANLYVTFNSNQFKAKDNENPTEDPDIRYSIENDSLFNLEGEGTRTKLEQLRTLDFEDKKLTRQERKIMESWRDTNYLEREKKLTDLINNSNLPEERKTELIYNELTSNEDLDGIITEDILNKLENKITTIVNDFEKEYKEKQEETNKRIKEKQQEAKSWAIAKKEADTYDNKTYNLLERLEEKYPTNRNGKRTGKEWYDFANELGQELKKMGKSEQELDKIAKQTWYLYNPGQNRASSNKSAGYDNNPVRVFNNSWVKAVKNGYESVNTILPTQAKIENKTIPIKEQQVTNQNEEIESQSNKVLANPEDVNLPEQNQKGRKTLQSIIQSEQTDETTKELARNMYKVDSYTPVSNVETLGEVNKQIRELGEDKLYNAFMGKMETGEKTTLKDIATGERLIQVYSKKGDYEKVNNLIREVAILGTELGQQVQALSLIRRATPEGQLRVLESLVNRANQKENTNVKITPEMTEKILNSKTQTELTNNIENAKKELAKQLPLNFVEKTRSWRYLSMLGNPKTHIRNIFANFGMSGVQDIKNRLAGMIEDITYAGNKNAERTKTLRFANKDQRNFARQDAKEMENLIDGGGKYEQKTTLEANKRAFDNKALNKVAEFNTNALDKEDKIFLKWAYRKAMSNYMAANNLTSEQMTGETLQRARNYASLQAQEATFHQFSQLAKTLGTWQNKSKMANFLVSAIVPFKKTPINIAKTGFDYSPAGLIKTTGQAIRDITKTRNELRTQLANGDITQEQYNSAITEKVNEGIDNLSKNLTGTSIALIGYALAKMGIIKAGNDDKEDEYEANRGNQQYSLQIGDYNFSLDWLAPSTVPLFMGAEIEKWVEELQTEDGDAGKSIGDFLDSASKMFEPMTDMSMIQGLTSALKSFESGSPSLIATNLIAKPTASYLGQYIPTALGQVAKSVDPYQRDTTSTQTGIPGVFDKAGKQALSKIPGLSQLLPTKVDVWGNKVKSDNYLQNAINPSTAKENKETATDKELKRLYESTGTNVFPTTFNLTKYYKKDGTEYRLTPEEYNEMKTNYGQTSKKYIDNLIKSSDYKKMTDTQKAKAITEIYTYAKNSNKIRYMQGQGLTEDEKSNVKTIKSMINEGANPIDYFAYKGMTDGMKKESEKNNALLNSNMSNLSKQVIYENNTGADDKFFKSFKETNPNMDAYLDYKTQDFTSDKDANGKTITNSKKNKVYNYMANSNFDYVQRLMLTAKDYQLQTSEKQYLLNYITGLDITTDEMIEMLENCGSNFKVQNGQVYFK